MNYLNIKQNLMFDLCDSVQRVERERDEWKKVCKLKRDLQYFNFLFVTLIYFIEVYFVWCVQANILCFYDRCTRSCYGVTLLPICNMHFHEFMHLFCMQNQHKNQLSVQYAYNFSHGLIYKAKGICIDRKTSKVTFTSFYVWKCLFVFSFFRCVFVICLHLNAFHSYM